jgi:hypothetical protein
MPVVTGTINLPAGVRPERAATAFVRVEDVGRADAAARRLGETVLENVTAADFARGSIAFTLSVPDPERNASCTLRVHLDLDGDRAVSRGDYVSTEHIPVLGSHPSSDVRVRLKVVG